MRETNDVKKLALDILFLFKEEMFIWINQENKGKSNNTVNSAPKVFVSNVCLICGIVIRLEGKNLGVVYLKKLNKTKQKQI